MNLKIDTPAEQIAQYLFAKNIIKKIPDDCSTEKPGEGNMNLVLRFRQDGKSLILKQSKPFVNKYPDIPAPEDRVHTEAKFFQYAGKVPSLDNTMPEIIFFDVENNLMVLQDLGEGNDFTYLYKKEYTLKHSELEFLTSYLTHLHQCNWAESEIKNFPKNIKLRQLNHQHIFVLPFLKNNGFDLNSIQKGLNNLAEKYMVDVSLKKEAKKLGDIYLSNGDTLLHGDYYPGSWMHTADGIKIIDPEFSFMGSCEFELGVFIAHLKMGGFELREIVGLVSKFYTKKDYNAGLAMKFAAIEIFRRIIGIAQLPLEMRVEEKSELLEEVYHWLKN